MTTAAYQFRVDFGPALKSKLAAEGVVAPLNFDQVLPAGLFPQAGDMWFDARLSDRTFLVVSRLFAWDAEGNLVHQLLLDLAPGPQRPFSCIDGVTPLGK